MSQFIVEVVLDEKRYGFPCSDFVGPFDDVVKATNYIDKHFAPLHQCLLHRLLPQQKEKDNG